MFQNVNTMLQDVSSTQRIGVKVIKPQLGVTLELEQNRS